MNTDQLAEIKERAEQAVALDNEASPGPWLLEHGKYSGANWLLGTVMCGTGFDDQEHYVHITTDSVKSDELSDAAEDAAFIAASRTAVPALAADVLALLAEVTRLNGEIENLQRAYNAEMRESVRRQ